MKGLDLFAAAVSKFHETGNAVLRVERDDGYTDTEDISWYLTTYPSFPKIEKQALKFARGHVLDVGAGAGRHSLYLQKRGLRVTAIDTSAQLVDLAHARGVKDVRIMDACRLMPFRDGEFDTILLFGNNLGIAGTLPKFRNMLQELYRVTKVGGSILATTRMPTTTDVVHRAYVLDNIKRGRPSGQVRLRLGFEGHSGPWFNLLLFSPIELMQLVLKCGWQVTQVFMDTDFQNGYAVVMVRL